MPSLQNSRVLETLRNETASLHQQLDTHPLFSRLLADDVSLAEFEAVIRVFRQWLTSLLNLAASQPDSHPVRESLALRLHWLGEGAYASGEADTERNTSAHQGSPHFWDGVYYVLEGSAMGGKRIAQHLRQTLHPAPASLAYFETHGPALGEHWRRVMQHLETRLSTPAALEVATEGATFTFQLLLLTAREHCEQI